MTGDVIFVTLRRRREPRSPESPHPVFLPHVTPVAESTLRVVSTRGRPRMAGQTVPMDSSTVQWDLGLGGASDVVWFAVAMAIVASLLWISYRTMQHPRLPVISRADKPPLVTFPGVARYALTIPFMVAFWQGVLVTLLAAAAKDRSGVQIVIAASAVIGGARLLAHINQEIAHELAKAVPITILSFIIIGSGFTGFEGFLRSFEQVPLELIDSYWFGLIMWDIALTTLWFAALQIRWRRQNRRVETTGTSEGVIKRLARRLREIGYREPV